MRIKKVIGGKTTYYIYSGTNPVMEYTPADGKYTYYVFAGMKMIAEVKDGIKKFYHKDHLGSIRVVTDASGSAIAEYKFKPYGETESHTGIDTKYNFTGKEEDTGTGLTYFGARFYDPESGRFTTIDPAKDGLNWYIYCNDSPLIYVDSNGKYARVVVDGNNISIILPINFVGKEATPGDVARIAAFIETTWSGTYGDLNVTVDVTTPGPGERANTIDLPLGGRNERSGCNKDNNYGVWFISNENGAAETAHEAGHLLGCEDRYEDYNILGNAFSFADFWWWGNIMAEAGGKGQPDKRNINEIMKSPTNEVVMPGTQGEGF